MSILKKYNVKPKKSLGQNFLIDKTVLNKIIKTAGLKTNDIILEIGPGLGILTKELAQKTKKVIAIEKDKNLCSILEAKLKDYNNIQIINADAIKDNYKLPTINYKLIANLPFNIASAVIRKFLEAKNPPKEMILTVQKEVAQRITAKPPKMSILAVSVRLYAKASIISYISKNSFYPKPKVDSAILRIIPYDKPSLSQKELFFKIVKAGFRAPRKQLINNLSKKLNLEKEQTIKWLEQNNINPTRRAETLSVDDWKSLTKNYPLSTIHF